MQTKTIDSVTGKKRVILPRAVRRQQLILATMRCISKVGLSSVTMAQVTKEAGLSRGIANLHFERKENLLIETLRFVTDEYNRGQAEILDAATFSSAAEQLAALVQFQFSRSVTEATKMAVWFAFYGEATSRPTYQKICADSDARAARSVRALFTQLGAMQEALVDVGAVTDGYIALIDGLWLNILLAPQKMTRAKAKRVAWTFLEGVFPSIKA